MALGRDEARRPGRGEEGLGDLGLDGRVVDEPEARFLLERVDDLLWNLRTWQLELVRWPVNNSQRIDIEYAHTTNRFGRAHVQQKHSGSPLPANERRQDRWNANPWDVSDGWDGMAEGDPGAWLLPYWMARYYGIITSPQE